MKVWVVFGRDWDTSWIDNVYSSQIAAEDRAAFLEAHEARQRQPYDNGERWLIEEAEVDAALAS